MGHMGGDGTERAGAAVEGPGGVAGSADCDVLVIGSGFGGSVAALRLAEKGYQVTVVEAGQRFSPTTLPKTSWDLRSYLWMPRLGCRGIQRITLLGKVLVLSGAAVGGGSVVYANTLYRPLEAFYRDPQWADVTDWRSELAPYYDQAERMLGATRNPSTTLADEVFRAVAGDLGVADTFRLTDVGVFFGRDGRREPGVTVPDPYFGGAGPSRTGCVECGECMTGCRRGAKNTLDHNYLYLAERLGARIVPDTTVRAVCPDGHGGYEIEAVRTGGGRRRDDIRRFRARQVVFAAGALGTQRLLLAMRDEGQLPALSARLGYLTRTNSEAILGASKMRPDSRIPRGVAITSSFYPNDHTHVEPVRYGRGSNLMALLSTAMTDGGGRTPRWVKFLLTVARRPQRLLLTLPWRWSERTMIALVMQSRDNSLTVRRRRGPFGISWLTSRPGHGEPSPTWIPEGNRATRLVAERMGGQPGTAITELADIPITAHILGGAVLSTDPSRGVVDPYHRVFGYPGLHVVDGAAVPANLGVNPSLTITAMAERAMACWPNRGEPDPRPELGAPYRRIAPVAPANPAVPAGAPGRYDVG
ncbi:cholesterol oxidase [Parafrankia irregularis]|uniref:Cholesterol oxidase n=2 Tax=Frankiaceae TaxID=74712 RepID=A0A0S4QT92_9ACTN|nr:cholesterol oxidase [Parafrankia irregularis]